MTFLRSVALLLPPARPTTNTEVASAPEWRGICEYPGQSPAEMAIQAGRAALKASRITAAEVDWVLHGGSGPQGALGWPVHHHIQHGIVRMHGNAVEIKQYCSTALTSWVFAAALVDRRGGTAICTGADNWSFGDRFTTSKADGGEPFSDAAHAAVLSQESGFAAILGTGNASCPAQADAWQTRESYWENATFDDYRSAFARAADARTPQADRDTVRMIVAAVNAALAQARVSPQYVDHFVPHTLGGGLYRTVAKIVGLPWSDALYDFYLAHGYLGVSTAMAGLLNVAESAELATDSIAVLLAVEYLLSATAVVLRFVRPPTLSANGLVRVAA